MARVLRKEVCAPPTFFSLSVLLFRLEIVISLDPKRNDFTSAGSHFNQKMLKYVTF